MTSTITFWMPNVSVPCRRVVFVADINCLPCFSRRKRNVSTTRLFIGNARNRDLLFRTHRRAEKIDRPDKTRASRASGAVATVTPVTITESTGNSIWDRYGGETSALNATCTLWSAPYHRGVPIRLKRPLICYRLSFDDKPPVPRLTRRIRNSPRSLLFYCPRHGRLPTSVDGIILNVNRVELRYNYDRYGTTEDINRWKIDELSRDLTTVSVDQNPAPVTPSRENKFIFSF